MSRQATGEGSSASKSPSTAASVAHASAGWMCEPPAGSHFRTTSWICSATIPELSHTVITSVDADGCSVAAAGVKTPHSTIAPADNAVAQTDVRRMIWLSVAARVILATGSGGY